MTKANVSNTLIPGILAFVLAGFGQFAFSSSQKTNGWILYGLAVIFFLIAFRSFNVAQFALGALSKSPDLPFRLSSLRVVLVSLGVLAMSVSIFLFATPANVPPAWTAHVVSVLLFIAAFVPFENLHRPSIPPRRVIGARLLRLLPIFVVLGIATFARLWQLGEFPFGDWYDEAVNGLAAGQILRDPAFHPIFVDTMPSHFNYLIAFSFSLFGISLFSLRLVTAAFGIAAVLFAYLLFRRWFGEVLGIVAACVLAVMRYHLTFSRFGMQGVATPAFELAAIYFLDRALAEKRGPAFAWLGLTLGFGLAFYHAFRLFPIVLGVFLVGLFIAACVKYGARESFSRYVTGMWQRWLIAALGLLIAVAPVAQFALRNPDQFFARTNNVSIFRTRDQPNLMNALWTTTVKHLEMFNVEGDRNGRHNLPGAPTLDPVMGALFVLGAAYAIWRWRDPPSSLMLLLFLFMLQGGILSLDFEAPQSLRAIGIIPALVYFITLPLAVVAQAIRPMLANKVETEEPKLKPVHHRTAQGRRSSPYVWRQRRATTTRYGIRMSVLRRSSGKPFQLSGSVLLLLSFATLLAFLTYLNFEMFFGKQEHDPSSWAQYSTAETLVANELNRHAAEYDFVVSALYDKSPTVRFLAGDITNVQRWTATDRLPLVRDDMGRGVIMMFDEKLMSAYNDAKRIYPGAKFIEHHAPRGGGPVMYEVIVAPDDLRAVQGVDARYYPGNAVQGKPLKEEVLPKIALDWTDRQPLSAPFVAELRGTLYASEYGNYHFSIHGSPDAKLWIDEQPVGAGPAILARGNHALRVQVPGGPSRPELWWQLPDAAQAQPVPAANLFRPPVTNSGLLGAYYPTPDWSGDPAFTQIDPEIALYFHVIPLERPYSVEWKGKLFAPTAGEYDFALYSVDGSQLTLDGRLAVDNPDGRTTIESVSDLAQGWHDITVRFADKTGGTQIYLYWTPPGTNERELIPSRYLSPPMGQYPDPNADH